MSSHQEGSFATHFSGGPASSNLDRTAAPFSGGLTCSQCHSGGGGTTNISVVVTDGNNVAVSSYVPGGTYMVKFTVTNSL